MSRLAIPALSTRPLRSTTSVSAQAAQPLALKSPTAQSPIHTDRFESQGSQSLRAVDKKKPEQAGQTESRFEANIERAIARAQYKKLKEQGPPQRLDFPLTPKGQLAYEKATDAYHQKVFDLAVAGGYIVT